MHGYVESLTTQKKYSLVLYEIEAEGGKTTAIDVKKMAKLEAQNKALEDRLAKLEAVLLIAIK